MATSKAKAKARKIAAQQAKNRNASKPKMTEEAEIKDIAQIEEATVVDEETVVETAEESTDEAIVETESEAEVEASKEDVKETKDDIFDWDKAEKKAMAKSKKAECKKEKGAKKGFFSRKFDDGENFDTIFTNTKIIAAIFSEIIGVALITMIVFTLGLYNPLYLILGYAGITAVAFKVSGAHLNPAITAGMMASRRVSAIRGTLYIIAQCIGAFAGWAIINAFYKAGLATGNIEAATVTLPMLTAAKAIEVTNDDGTSLVYAIAALEFVMSFIICFFYAASLRLKKNTLAISFTIASGVFLAMLFAVVISGTYLGISDNSFVANPAVALFYGMMPKSAEGFDAFVMDFLPQFAVYAVVPMVAGIISFFASDAITALNGEDYAI